MKTKKSYLLAIAFAALSLGACSGANIESTNYQAKPIASNLDEADTNLVLAGDVLTEAIDEEIINEEETEEETPAEEPTENPEEETPVEEPVVEKTEEEIRLEKINNLVGKYKALTTNNVYKVENVESDNEDYSFKMNVSLNYEDTQKAITLYFNEKVKEEQVEDITEPVSEDLDDVVDTSDLDNENEIVEEQVESTKTIRRKSGNNKTTAKCTRYSGLLIYGETEIEVSGKRIEKENYTYTKVQGKFEDKSKLVFESYVTDDSVVFDYQISKGWKVKDSFYFSTNKVNDANKISIITYSNGSFEYYDFVGLATTNALALEVSYINDTGYGTYKILTEGDELVYTIVSEFTYPTVEEEPERDNHSHNDHDSHNHHNDFDINYDGGYHDYYFFW